MVGELGAQMGLFIDLANFFDFAAIRFDVEMCCGVATLRYQVIFVVLEILGQGDLDCRFANLARACKQECVWQLLIINKAEEVSFCLLVADDVRKRHRFLV